MNKIIKILFDIDKDNDTFFRETITIVNDNIAISEILNIQHIVSAMRVLHEVSNKNTLTSLEITNLDEPTHTETYVLNNTYNDIDTKNTILCFINKSYNQRYPEEIRITATTEGFVKFLTDLI